MVLVRHRMFCLSNFTGASFYGTQQYCLLTAETHAPLWQQHVFEGWTVWVVRGTGANDMAHPHASVCLWIDYLVDSVAIVECSRDQSMPHFTCRREHMLSFVTVVSRVQPLRPARVRSSRLCNLVHFYRAV